MDTIVPLEELAVITIQLRFWSDNESVDTNIYKYAFIIKIME
jgi:hypothetical protein